jgi:hypothetical protein
MILLVVDTQKGCFNEALDCLWVSGSFKRLTLTLRPDC